MTQTRFIRNWPVELVSSESEGKRSLFKGKPQSPYTINLLPYIQT